MKIQNRTLLNSRQLGALIRAVAVKECFTAQEIADLCVKVRYRRRTHVRPDNHPGGWAHYNSSIFCLTFVKGVALDSVGTAKTIAHELAHCQGVHHGRSMSNKRYGWEPGWKDTWAWAAEYPLECRQDPKAVKPTGEDRVIEKMRRCQEALDTWNRKLKMAATKAKKWKIKLRYYEKRLAAMPTVPAEAPAVVEGNANDQQG